MELLPETPKARKRPVKTLYLGHYGGLALQGWPNASARFEHMARRFDQMTRAAIPADWTLAEWAVVVLGLREGAGIADHEAWSVLLGWAHVSGEAMEAVYGVDAVEVARKLRDAGAASNVAVMDLVDRYWAMPEAMDFADRMEKLALASRADAAAWRRAKPARDAAIAQLRVGVSEPAAS